MSTNVSTAVRMPLNSHPSQPEERANQHLPPKSYAEATMEGDDKETDQVPHKVDEAALPRTANGSAKVNGLRRNIDQDRVIYDKHASMKGEKLTSIKPDESHEEALKHNALSAPIQKGRSGKKHDTNDAKLASGRRAGAGWQRSASALPSMKAFQVDTDSLQNPLGTSQHSAATPTSDTGGAVAHNDHADPYNILLSPLCHSGRLAFGHPLSHLHTDLQRRGNLGYSVSTITKIPWKQDLVIVCLVFSCATAPNCGAGADKEIHLWLSPAWYH